VTVCRFASTEKLHGVGEGANLHSLRSNLLARHCDRYHCDKDTHILTLSIHYKKQKSHKQPLYDAQLHIHHTATDKYNCK